MSVRQRQNVAYGLSQPLIPEAPAPIAAHRNPTTTDYAAIGTIWSNTLTSTVFILASIIANVATWIQVAAGAGAGVFASLVVTPGPISLTGTTTVNTAGAATTTIGNAASTTAIVGATNINIAGAAATTIGNAASTTTITGTANINTAGAGATNIGVGGTGAISIGNAVGGTTIAAGNFVVTNGDIRIAGNAAYQFIGGPSILAGAGDPNGIVFAAVGSLYLNETGSGIADRLFVNTDGLSTWTNFVSAA